jgi:hypothetical protein
MNTFCAQCNAPMACDPGRIARAPISRALFQFPLKGTTTCWLCIIAALNGALSARGFDIVQRFCSILRPTLDSCQ